MNLMMQHQVACGDFLLYTPPEGGIFPIPPLIAGDSFRVSSTLDYSQEEGSDV